MGTNFSPRELEAIGWKKNPLMHGLLRINPIRGKVRKSLRKIGALGYANLENLKTDAFNFDLGADEFRDKSYAYLENALPSSCYESLVVQFPPRKFFDPFYDLTKTYDWGFVWNRGKPDPEYLDLFPALKAMYDYVRSNEFCQKVTEMCGDDVERQCYSIDTTFARSGAYLTPHQDAVIEDGRGSAFVNFIYFVTGNGEPFTCGGTSISSDAEMNKLLFVPNTLNNSMVMYKSQENIWHGFRPIGKGQCRRAIIFQYCSKTY